MLHSWSPVVMFHHLSSSSTISVGIFSISNSRNQQLFGTIFYIFLLHVIFYISKVVYCTTCWIGRRDCSTFLKCSSHILFTSRAFRWFWQSFRLFGYLTSRCAPDHSQWHCFLACWRNICHNFSDSSLDVMTLVMSTIDCKVLICGLGWNTGVYSASELCVLLWYILGVCVAPHLPGECHDCGMFYDWCCCHALFSQCSSYEYQGLSH